MKKSNYKLPGLPGLPAVPPSTAKQAATRTAGLSKISGYAQSALKPVQFGRAPHAAVTSPKSSGSFSRLLSASTSKSGVGATISQALGFGGGIGSLISGITGFFGGGSKPTPPPLTAYQLPGSQSQTISIGTAVLTQHAQSNTTIGSSSENHGAYIVQSVKHALLTSSALNDVIAEL